MHCYLSRWSLVVLSVVLDSWSSFSWERRARRIPDTFALREAMLERNKIDYIIRSILSSLKYRLAVAKNAADWNAAAPRQHCHVDLEL